MGESGGASAVRLGKDLDSGFGEQWADSANACYLKVSPNGVVQMADDAASFDNYGNVWVGNSWAISRQNSHCQINGPASSFVTVTNGGANLQETLNLVFGTAWSGHTPSIWMRGFNVNYVAGGWQQFGTFTVE